MYIFLSVSFVRCFVPFVFFPSFLSFSSSRGNSKKERTCSSAQRFCGKEKKEKKSSKGEQVFSESRLYHKVAASFTNGLRRRHTPHFVSLLFFVRFLLSFYFVSFRGISLNNAFTTLSSSLFSSSPFHSLMHTVSPDSSHDSQLSFSQSPLRTDRGGLYMVHGTFDYR